MAQLYIQFTSAQEELLPKKKFSFKSRPRKAAAPKPTVNPGLALAREASSTPAVPLGDSGKNQTHFSGKEKELIAPMVRFSSVTIVLGLDPVVLCVCVCVCCCRVVRFSRVM